MSRILEDAKKYIGLSETENPGQLTALVHVDVRTTPWCAAFVNAILHDLGIKGTDSNLARSFLKLGTDSTKDPQIGDLVVFQRGNSSWQGHITILAEEFDSDEDTVTCLGGNQKDSVCYAAFRKDNILGIRRVE